MTGNFDLEDADEVAVAAHGDPGQRVFLLRARKGAVDVTLKVEKQQVGALVLYLVRLLRSTPSEQAVTAQPPGDIPEGAEPDFVVGSLAVSYDEASDRVVVVAEELVPDEETPASARFVVTRAQAAGLATEGQRLVEGGRPPCPFCGYPLDERGHVCPRTNGSHPPRT